MGKRRKGTLFSDSLRKNDNSFNLYFDRLFSIAMSVFEWNGLPESVDVWYLEKTITDRGSALIFQDDIIKEIEGTQKSIFGLPWVLKSKYNKYMYPIKRTAYANNGYKCRANEDNSVIIYDNVLKNSIIPGIRYYADRLWNMDRVVDVNINAQKTPVLIKCPESQKMTLKNAYMQYDGNAPFIFAYDDFNEEGFKVLSTGAPYVAENIHDLKTRIWNEALTFVGVSNVTIQKKERMIKDEVMQEMGGTIASRYTRLIPRQEAAKKINRIWGDELEEEVTVNFRNFSDTDLSMPGDEVDLEGEEEVENEQIYNGS